MRIRYLKMILTFTYYGTGVSASRRSIMNMRAKKMIKKLKNMIKGMTSMIVCPIICTKNP